MIYNPIWRDTYYEVVNANSSVTYDITDSSNAVLYSGKAYLKPDDTSIYININRIAENYVNNDLPDNWLSIAASATPVYTSTDAVKVFKLWVDDTLVESYTFTADWSYKDWTSAMTGTISTPINSKYVNGMYELTSNLTLTSITTTFSKVVTSTAPTKGCYALYYKQRNGAWSQFLFEGRSKKTDSYEKYFTDRTFDNNSIEFETNVYHSEITTIWELTSGWLSDEESDNFTFNLLSSNRAYLHSLYDNTIVPVILTDEDGVYKTYDNNNRKLVSYTITVQASQKKQLK